MIYKQKSREMLFNWHYVSDCLLEEGFKQNLVVSTETERLTYSKNEKGTSYIPHLKLQWLLNQLFEKGKLSLPGDVQNEKWSGFGPQFVSEHQLDFHSYGSDAAEGLIPIMV